MSKQPATPLPWVATESYGLTRGALNGATVAGFGLKTVANIPRRNYSDAAYIAHTANAYPRLVDALRDVMRNDKFKAVAEIKARQLLKELGE